MGNFENTTEVMKGRSRLENCMIERFRTYSLSMHATSLETIDVSISILFFRCSHSMTAEYHDEMVSQN